jgi:hypothetical protein
VLTVGPFNQPRPAPAPVVPICTAMPLTLEVFEGLDVGLVFPHGDRQTSLKVRPGEVHMVWARSAVIVIPLMAASMVLDCSAGTKTIKGQADKFNLSTSRFANGLHQLDIKANQVPGGFVLHFKRREKPAQYQPPRPMAAPEPDP